MEERPGVAAVPIDDLDLVVGIAEEAPVALVPVMVEGFNEARIGQVRDIRDLPVLEIIDCVGCHRRDNNPRLDTNKILEKPGAFDAGTILD